MAKTDFLTITASGSAGVNTATFFADWFAGLSGGGIDFYGGTPDSAFGGTYYMNGSQAVATYSESDATAMLVGEEIAYDFIHHGSSYGHGISGAVDEVVFGAWTEATTGEQGTGAEGEVTGLDVALTLSGLGLDVEPGSGSENPVNALYAALQAADASVFEALLAERSLQFLGAAGEDVFTGGDYQDEAHGGAGDDVLTGGGAKDRLYGGAGDDLLYGNAWRDHLFGGQGADELFGGKCADLLDGGAGDDVLTGGKGPDRFDFSAPAGDDAVTDFDVAGGDKLLVSADDFANFKALSEAFEQVGADLAIDLGHGASVTLLGVDADALTRGDFAFV